MVRKPRACTLRLRHEPPPRARDLLAPEEFRGIGVRIEDDVLVTADGCENLSGMLPRTVADVEAWMASLRAAAAPSR